MMGLVGNVAEVKRLRNRLMKSEFITVFSNLLDSDSDGIEVSFFLSLLQLQQTKRFGHNQITLYKKNCPCATLLLNLNSVFF